MFSKFGAFVAGLGKATQLGIPVIYFLLHPPRSGTDFYYSGFGGNLTDQHSLKKVFNNVNDSPVKLEPRRRYHRDSTEAPMY
jgi:hypothetical protein